MEAAVRRPGGRTESRTSRPRTCRFMGSRILARRRNKLVTAWSSSNLNSHENHQVRAAHPLPGAVRHRRRDPVAGPRDRRERRDLLDLQPDAAVAVAGAGARTAGEPLVAGAEAGLDLLRPGRATAIRCSATRCSATCRRCRPSSPMSPPTSNSAPTSRSKGRRSAAGDAGVGQLFPGARGAAGDRPPDLAAGRPEGRRIAGRRAQPRLLDAAGSASAAMSSTRPWSSTARR